MLNPRRAGAAAAALTAAALLAGCSGTGDPAPDPTAAASPGASDTPGGASTKLGGPLTAKDLGAGWVDVAGAPASADLVEPCGTGTGVADLQRAARTQVLTAPGGGEVVVRVATYASRGAEKAAQAAEDAFGNCPLIETVSADVITALVTEDVQDGAVGALLTTVAATGDVTDASGYWLVRVGDATVEVYAHELFARTSARDPMDQFVTGLRDAATAKALGQPVPAVSVPPLAGAAPGQALPNSGSGSDPDGDPDSDPVLPEGEIGPGSTFG